jgi:hypothetical protein
VEDVGSRPSDEEGGEDQNEMEGVGGGRLRMGWSFVGENVAQARPRYRG